MILDDGSVKCWGHNGRGQLGYGDTQSRGDGADEMGDNLPTVDLGLGRSAKFIASGGEHTCAILEDGGVKCWGRNDEGQLGYGDIQHRGDGAGEMGDNLEAVYFTPTVKTIAAGRTHTCALLYDGSVKCWGGNTKGQLGLGDTQNRGAGAGEMGDNLPTVDLGPGRSAKSIATRHEHVCAILDDDSVKCWGGNDYGQLGYGDTQNRGDCDTLPAIDLASGRSAKFIAAGGYHTCAILDDGSVKCWGRNYYGQLGYGDTQNRGDGAGEMGDNLPSVDLGPGRSAKFISASKLHTCVQLDDGSVKCWGGNNYGQLGLGNTQNRGDAPHQMGDDLTAVDLGRFDVAEPWPFVPYPCAKM